jgi:hypothetical protein
VARLKPIADTKKRYPSKRERIDHFVAALKKGTEFSARQVAKKFNLSNGEQAAGYLWQRGDVKNIAHGRWIKI